MSQNHDRKLNDVCFHVDMCIWTQIWLFYLWSTMLTEKKTALSGSWWGAEDKWRRNCTVKESRGSKEKTKNENVKFWMRKRKVSKSKAMTNCFVKRCPSERCSVWQQRVFKNGSWNWCVAPGFQSEQFWLSPSLFNFSRCSAFPVTHFCSFALFRFTIFPLFSLFHCSTYPHFQFCTFLLGHFATVSSGHFQRKQRPASRIVAR